MRRTVIFAVALGLGLLAGCDNGAEPAPPPTSQDALTTATVEPAPQDEVEATTDAAPATSEAAPTTAEPTEEAGGAPEMPDEAKEQTEAGAEAFALHYLDLINYTGMHPETGLLEPLGAEGCKSCDNHEDAVAYGVEHGDYLEQDTFTLDTPMTIFTEDSARVAIPAVQQAQTFYRDGQEIDREIEQEEASLIVRVVWDGGWKVSEITVEQ